tara:strand:+ start:771 stop:893 length:123 start_codon:yes stop_codon:yes gene_type:complete
VLPNLSKNLYDDTDTYSKELVMKSYDELKAENGSNSAADD